MENLLLAIYFLVVFYVLYQMALSLERTLEDAVYISVDTKFLEEQVRSQLDTQLGSRPEDQQVDTGVQTPKGKDGKPGRFILDLKFESKGDGPPPIDIAKLLGLTGKTMTEEQLMDMARPKISIWVTPTGLERIRPFPNLSVTVKNTSEDQQVYINWDRSTLVISNQGHRVIRNTPNMPLDLSQPQIFSVVNPGQTVSSNINIERNFTRDPATNQVRRTQALIDVADRLAFMQMALSKKPGDEKNKRQDASQSLCDLDLMIGFKHVTSGDHTLINLLVPFSLSLTPEPDQIALPPLRWLLKHIGKRGRPQRRGLFGLRG
ncbi:MAG: hypothetical protein AAF050_23135 [Cyanobacteria bacterium J06649_5]